MTGTQPLVSVIVITFNSSKFVSETLESAKAQTYPNIELIVSDDCSADNTAEICREWMERNAGRFAGSELITSERNTGVAVNCNRGLRAAKGEWVKFIAGDDVLADCCIEKFMEAVNGDIKIICSETMEFYGERAVKTDESGTGVNVNPAFIRLNDAGRQFKYFLKGFYIPGPGLFLERRRLEELGGFDERFRNSEIRPLLLKYTFNNIRIHYLPQILVLHRRHPGAATAKTDKIIASYLHEAYRAIYFYANISRNILLMINAKWHLCLMRIIILAGNRGRRVTNLS